MTTYLILNGPNLNMLGVRDTSVYGTLTLDQINAHIQAFADKQNVGVEFIQSNEESALIHALQTATSYAGIVFNPAAFTHTSIALHDAIEAINVPVVEVHLSHVYRRESFRHVSMTAPACVGQMTGFGWRGYVMALDYLIQTT